MVLLPLPATNKILWMDDIVAMSSSAESERDDSSHSHANVIKTECLLLAKFSPGRID